MDKNNKIYIGIDPGLMGGIVALMPERKMLEIHETPLAVNSETKKKDFNVNAFIEIMRRYDNMKEKIIVYIENQLAIPDQSVKATAKTFFNLGLMKGVCSGLNFEIFMINPKAWQAVFFPHGNTKQKSYQVACDLYPSCKQRFTGKRGGIKDGLTDACLIAEYGKWHYNHPIHSAMRKSRVKSND